MARGGTGGATIPHKMTDAEQLDAILAAYRACGGSRYINDLEVFADRVRRALDGRDWREE